MTLTEKHDTDRPEIMWIPSIKFSFWALNVLAAFYKLKNNVKFLCNNDDYCMAAWIKKMYLRANFTLKNIDLVELICLFWEVFVHGNI